MRAHRGAFFVGLIAAAWLLWPATASVQTTPADALFDDKVLHEVRLSINSKDLAVLREKYQENTYFTADMTADNHPRVRNVGVRSRGYGSRSATKLGLKIEFDKYTTGQQFLGMKSLVLDNLWQDRALVREFMAMAVFRRVGEAAPRESFARLYINNVYQGLYTIVEDVTEAYVTRTIGDSGGYLYEYKFRNDYYMGYPGDDYATYRQMFEPRNHEMESDSTLFEPLRQLFLEINAGDDAVWKDRVDGRIDIAQFMTHVGVQGFLANNDGIMGGFGGINNFYVYRFRDSVRHRLFAWDEDQAFAALDFSILRQGAQDVVLFQRARAYPEYFAAFLDAAQRSAERAMEDNWLATELERVVTLITPAVLEDTRKQFSNTEFEDGIAFLREFASFRPQFVLDEVQRERQR